MKESEKENNSTVQNFLQTRFIWEVLIDDNKRNATLISIESVKDIES